MSVFVFFKKKFVSILFVLFIVFLVMFSNSTFTATKTGLSLWANNVIPSLFPFLVAVELLNQTNVVYYLSIYLDKYMKPLFNLPGISAFPFIMGVLSGYPIGAKIVSDLYDNGACTKDEAERMLPFTNNSGPLFIIGTVGISFYANSTIGVILLITHVFASITVGIITGFLSRIKIKNDIVNTNYSMKPNKDISISELGEILGSAITKSIKTLLIIGGFVTLFSVIITLLEKARILIIISNIIGSSLRIEPSIINAFITGIIEFTNGLSRLSNIHLKELSVNIILSAFIIGFGGISVTLQVLSIISKHHLSIRKYIISKFFQAFIAGFYTYLLLQLPFFDFNL